MKIALGCVQFGMKYGVANAPEPISLEETRRILCAAHDGGIDTLDTASSYGESEATLGKIGVEEWRIVTKLPTIPPGIDDIQKWVTREVRNSCRRLRVDSVEAILVHNPSDLLGSHGAELVAGLAQAKACGLARAAGVSIYEPEDLDRLAGRFQPDVVQAPFNVFDRRIVDSGWAERLATSGCCIHIRSIFLQGLLLMPPAARPEKFSRFAPALRAWDTFCARQQKSPLEVCLQYALSQTEFDRIVVGVASLEQMRQILGADMSKPLSLLDVDVEIPLELIDPSCWKQL